MIGSNKYLLISVITFVSGYFFLRLAFFNTHQHPFAQEIILIVLGTIATIAITAALINKQSEIELEKEQRVKIFDLKSNLYFDLIEFVEKVLSKNQITQKDMVTLEFLTHKISVIANPEVLHSYAELIQVIKDTALDKQINSLESDELSAVLAKLCGKIRYDLVSKEEEETVSQIQRVIVANISKIRED